jgi:hypothetical protein
MEITKHTDPWVHYTIKDFITYDENCMIYHLCMRNLDEEAYKDKSMFWLDYERDEHSQGEYQNNAPVFCPMPHELNVKIQSQLDQINDYLDIHDLTAWSFNTNLTYDHKDKPLRPHNDDYEKLKQYGAGKIKLLVYIGLNNRPYPNWGTKLYTRADDYSSFAKEIEYEPGTAFFFVPNETSYHGTDFTDGLDGYRFILGAEYA